MPPEPKPLRPELVLLAVLSAFLLTVRLYAAGRIGFGDSEALYACYGLFPQPAYLDHPGLVGLVMRAIGGATAPTPASAHRVTAVAATLVPWAMLLACRAGGASWPRAATTALVVALAPEVAIGLFALTPDLLLALAWIAAIALASTALRSQPGSARAAAAFGLAGVLAGIAAISKATGITLLAALACTYAAPPARPHARTAAPWAGLLAGTLMLLPVVSFEARHGWPMIRHRLVDTQSGAGLSLRNAAAVLGGQAAYLSPLVAWLAVLAARELWKDRGDRVGSLLLACSVVPLAALLPLSLWSRVAEPHWLAPALLSLGPAAARASRSPPRRLVIAASGLAGAMVVAVHVWVLVPSLIRFAPAGYDARLDLANELYGWPQAVRVVREEALASWTPGSERGDVTIVGPHWVVCAQLEAGLHGDFPVGCDTPVRDDFDDWEPRARWRTADVLVWVSDARFGPPPPLPTHTVQRLRHVTIERGGRPVRAFVIAVLTRRQQA